CLFHAKISADTILMGVIIGFSILVIYLQSRSWFLKVVFPAALSMIMVNYYLNRDFYPALLTYQSESAVAFFIERKNIDKSKLASFLKQENAADFYLKTIVPEMSPDEIVTGKWDDKFLFTS